MSNEFETAFYFLGRFLRRPKHVASVWPSSRFLAEQMFRGLNLTSGDVVLEYGPGTGSLTREVERLRGSGIDVRYLGVEKDPGMYQYLVRNFPSLEFVLGDAADVVHLCEARSLPPAAAVISGLPLILMNYSTLTSIFSATRACLRSDGVFRTFSYVHSYPSRSAKELRELMEEYFDEYRLSRPVLRNVPPAFMMTGRVPREAQELHESAEFLIA
jgi:phospholipid N-methyltransferase